MAPSTPLVHPAEYFDRLDRPSLGIAAGVVTVQAIALVSVLYWFLTAAFARVEVPTEAQGELQGMITGALPGVFAAAFVGWLLLSAVLHLFVWFADGDRGFGATLAVVGVAELASLATLPLTVAGFYVLLGRVPADPQAAAEFFRQATSFSTPLLLVSSVVGTVWRVYIQSVGLALVHDLPYSKTLLVTGAVGAVGVLINLV